MVSDTAIIDLLRCSRNYGQSSTIIKTLVAFSSDPQLDGYPSLKKYLDKMNKGHKFKLSHADLNTIKDFFNGDESLFKKYLASLVINYHTNNTYMYSAGPYLSEINAILFRDTSSRVDLNGKYQRITVSKACGELRINDSVPPLVENYLYEAILCLGEKFYRSCIVFCIISLECAIRIKYNLLTKKHSDGIYFVNLIEWAIKEKVILENDINRPNITFMRRYRNSLVHTDDGEYTEKHVKESWEKAEKMAHTIFRLTELFVNNIFF